MSTQIPVTRSTLHGAADRRLPWARQLQGPALLIAGFTLLRLLLAATTPLLPQEAYYWSWSRHLAAGYFDHPPLVSWAIALSTAVFGSTVFGIKSAAVAWSLGWNLLWARLIDDMYGSRRLAFWSLLALNLTLVYEVYGVGPTPDGPLLFGWVGTVWAVWRATTRGQNRWSVCLPGSACSASTPPCCCCRWCCCTWRPRRRIDTGCGGRGPTWRC
jgi:4-amino-4-deoxy-L-arabinose transferase-like glycosyltransferase